MKGSKSGVKRFTIHKKKLFFYRFQSNFMADATEIPGREFYTKFDNRKLDWSEKGKTDQNFERSIW